MKLTICNLMIGVWLASISSLVAEDDEFTHVRLLDRAEADPSWEAAGMIKRLEIIRNLASAEMIASEPVSDRYSITFYAGPIDWVHFLNLTIFVYSGDQKFGEAQYDQWKAEGGIDWEAGRTEVATAATPDDLPSNALGALFATELREAKNPDLRQQLLRFVAPLKPVPDRVAKQFARNEIVLGLSSEPTRQERDRAYAWFTAEPVNLTKKLSKSMSLPAEPTGAAALGRAGFRITKFRGKPVVIQRAR